MHRPLAELPCGKTDSNVGHALQAKGQRSNMERMFSKLHTQQDGVEACLLRDLSETQR